MWLYSFCALLLHLSTAHGQQMAPVLELVIARYMENINWIAKVDECWNITVYNKGDDSLPANRAYTRVDLPNQGREGGTFLWHIVTRYDALADLTVFAQAKPFVSGTSKHSLALPILL